MAFHVLYLTSRLSGTLVAWGVRREGRAQVSPVTGVLPRFSGLPETPEEEAARLVAGRLQAIFAGLVDMATQLRSGDVIEVITDVPDSLLGAIADVPEPLKQLLASVRTSGVDLTIGRPRESQQKDLERLSRQLEMALARVS